MNVAFVEMEFRPTASRHAVAQVAPIRHHDVQNMHGDVWVDSTAIDLSR